MDFDKDFRRIEKLLYEYKTYALAIKNLKEDIDDYGMPTCISNYSTDPVSYTVGNTSDSTYNHAMKRVKDADVLDEMQRKLKVKLMYYNRINDVLKLGILDDKEKVVWERRYIRDEDVAVIYDSEQWSKTTYFRVRKELVKKFMKCWGIL